MSRLFYNIKIEEVLEDSDYNIIKEWNKNLPHAKEIADWLPGEWDKCDIKNCFSDPINGNVQSCNMRCFVNKDNELIARVTIDFKPGYRLSEKRRNIVWDNMDGQMTDGFGESYYLSEIPGVPKEYRLSL